MQAQTSYKCKHKPCVQAQKIISVFSRLIPVVIKMIIGKRQVLVLWGLCLSLRSSGRSAVVDSRGTQPDQTHLY